MIPFLQLLDPAFSLVNVSGSALFSQFPLHSTNERSAHSSSGTFMISSVPRELVKDHQEGATLLLFTQHSPCACSPLILCIAVLGLELVRIQGCFSMTQLKQSLGWPEARCRDTVNFFLKEVG
jgi:hypothetical protein